MRIVHIVADYSPGDLAFGEIVSALARHLPKDFGWHCTSAGSFDTVATGFVVAQLALHEEKLRAPTTLIYANCAPRRDRSEARQDNEGEGLLYGVLKNGVPLVIVNSGYSLSFVRDDLKELWSVNLDKGGSQFRSRDIFPPIVGKAAHGTLDFLREQLNPQKVVPPPPLSVIGYIDSFGNIKTTVRAGDPAVASLAPGQRLIVRINGIERMVTVATGSFNVSEGDIAFAPGSSGHDRRYWEIFQRGGSAHITFGNPRVGADIAIGKP